MISGYPPFEAEAEDASDIYNKVFYIQLDSNGFY
jgi:hypothetical protein